MSLVPFRVYSSWTFFREFWSQLITAVLKRWCFQSDWWSRPEGQPGWLNIITRYNSLCALSSWTPIQPSTRKQLRRFRRRCIVQNYPILFHKINTETHLLEEFKILLNFVTPNSYELNHSIYIHTDTISMNWSLKKWLSSTAILRPLLTTSCIVELQMVSSSLTSAFWTELTKFTNVSFSR